MVDATPFRNTYSLPSVATATVRTGVTSVSYTVPGRPATAGQENPAIVFLLSFERKNGGSPSCSQPHIQLGECHSVAAAVGGGNLRHRHDLHRHRCGVWEFNLRTTLTIEVLDDVELDLLRVEHEEGVRRSARILVREDQVRATKLQRLDTGVNGLRVRILEVRLEAVCVGRKRRRRRHDQIGSRPTTAL